MALVGREAVCELLQHMRMARIEEIERTRLPRARAVNLHVLLVFLAIKLSFALQFCITLWGDPRSAFSLQRWAVARKTLQRARASP